MASEAGISGAKVRADRKHMFSVLVLTGGSWIIVANSGGINLGVKHQIPYLAWTYGHDHFHGSWSLLHHLLGLYARNLRGICFFYKK